MTLTTKKITFGKQPFVASRVVPVNAPRVVLEDADRFREEWKADRTVDVRAFSRNVRAGGCSTAVVVIVVRRKVTPAE